MRILTTSETMAVAGGDRWGEENTLIPVAPVDATNEARNALSSGNAYAWDMLGRGTLLVGAGILAIATAPVALSLGLTAAGIALGGVGGIAAGAGASWASWGKDRITAKD
jgi:hypothetical protein